MKFIKKTMITQKTVAVRIAIIFVSFFISFSFSNAQSIELTTGHSAASLAETITGNGVTILNPVVNCADSAIGKYTMSAIPNFSGEKGIVLSTGNIFDTRGPNNSQSTTTSWERPGDPIIKKITGYPNFDACILEFDVVPVGDTLKFDFIFASEEYHEYVGTPFNDVFGFFISGPGIQGDPGLDGLENIALIPNTNQYVGINTVNKGNPDTGFPPVNNQYFVNNPLGYNTHLQYDGWTKGLYAKKVVHPCDTFHLKLIIADVADDKWDSSVFIEKIESNNITVSGTTVGGNDEMIEGCNGGTITFTRDPVTSDDLVVTYYIDGTAINGVDYPLIGTDPSPTAPKYITIPANQASASISILPYADGIDEGIETVKIYVGNPFCSPAIQDSLTIFILDSLPIAIDPPLAFVCLGADVELTAVSPGTNFNWAPNSFIDDLNAQTITASPVNDITYTVTASLAGCSSSASVDVFISDIQLSPNLTHVLCGGANNGAINLGISNGIPPYNVQWSGPSGFSSTSQNISNLQPGTYIAHVTDREGCTENITLEILETAAMEIDLSSPVFVGGHHVSCAESQNGQITATVQFGTGPYTYSWDDANNQTTQTATNLKAGTYTVTVTDANNCTSSETITLTAPEPVSGTTISKQNVLCHGQATGSATVAGEGGTAPYTYAWNTIPPQSGTTAHNLKAGTYIVTVTDVNGCLGNIEVEIQEPAAAISGVVNTTNVLCFGEATGSASANIIGGTQPYTYSWSSEPSLNDPSIDNLSAGNYTLTVSDANGCNHTIAFNITQPPALQIQNVATQHVSCHGENDGSITISAVGGKAPYNYTWNTTPEQNGNHIENLSAGAYTVLITDANGCTAETDVVISEPDELELSIEEINSPLCYNSFNGTIEVSATGGTAPYQYTWNTTPPTSGNTLTNISSGHYEVAVTDANGCSITQTIELTAPEPLTIAIDEINHVLCHGEQTGSATVSVTGGTPEYQYLWDDPLAQNTATASNLAAGTYTVSITDENGCQATTSITITEPQSSLQAAITNSEDVLCFGVNNGWATVTASGGSGSYSYQWNDDNNQQTATATNLAPGTYTVSVYDNNGCTNPVLVNVVINGPSEALTLTPTPSQYPGGANLICADDSMATINLGISGGTAPYTILWNFPDGTTTSDQDLTDLPPGNYLVTVTDANGCEESQNIQIIAPQPIVVNTQTTSSLCFGSPSGSIDITIDGGAPAYDIVWNGPGGFTSTDFSLTNLEGGVYYITITDAAGCVHEDAVTVTQPEDLIITVDSLSDYNGFNLTCYNSADGEIYITPSGGTQPYEVQWNKPGSPNFSNQEDLIYLKAGTYEAVVTDDNGCIQNTFVDIIGPDTIKIDFSLSQYPNGFNISCSGSDDGSISAIPTGGIGDFTYVWVGPFGYGPVMGNPIENLGPGNYSVLATDENGCIAMQSVKITAPNPFSIEVEATEINGYNISCEGANDGAINLIVKGGRFPVTVQSVLWSGPNGFTSTDHNISNLAPGTYCVTVTNTDDCDLTECITLTEPSALSVNLAPAVHSNGFNISCEGANDGEITATINGGTSNYNISWSGPNNFSSSSLHIDNLTEGTYCVSIFDDNGCTFTKCITLTAADQMEISDSNVVHPACGSGATGSIEIVISGGEPGYSFQWTGPAGFTSSNQNITDLNAGTYCVEILDVNSCTVQKCFTLNSPSELNLVLSASVFEGGSNISCHGQNDASITTSITGGSGPYTYNWTGPGGFVSTSKNLENLAPGQYCLEITDDVGCIEQSCTTIAEPDILAINSSVNMPSCGDGSPATIETQISGGAAPYTFNWNNGTNGSTITVGNGTYHVIISDANGCTITDSYTIVLPEPIQAVPVAALKTGGYHLSCFESGDGEISLNVYGNSGNISVQWNGPNGFSSNDTDIAGLEAGEYCVTITDDLGCSDQTCITLTQPSGLAFNYETTMPTCSDETNGSISLNISGGIPTYQISWTGPDGFTSSGSAISGIKAGQYCFSATDLNNCVVSDCIELQAPLSIDINLDAQLLPNGYNISCYGTPSGKITPVISGGSGNYTYQWAGPGGFSSTDDEITNLYAGTYCLTITDGNNCTTQECVTLTEPQPADVVFNAFEFPTGFHTSCYDVCDGSLEAIVTGGAAPLSVNWVGPNGFTSNDLQLSNLCAGTYILQLTDVNGCIQDTSFAITRPQKININLNSPVFGGGNNIACYNDDSGVIETQLSGGFGNLSVMWTGPNGFLSTDQNLEELPAGTYQITVTDESNCEATAAITLTQPQEELLATATPFEFNSGTNISCKNAADGSISTWVTGGTAPYTYNWNGPDGFNSNQSQLTNLEAGDYTLVVEDVNSCVYTINLNLSEPSDSLFAEAEITGHILCAGDNTGKIEVTATGGSASYNISWTGPDGFTSDQMTIDNLIAGNYTYMVKDENGCSYSETIVLDEPEPMNVSAQIIDADCQTETGIIQLSVSNGTSPYMFLWENGSTSQSLVNVAPGSYSVTITDANNCTYIDTFEVGSENNMEINATITDLSCYGDESGMITIELITAEEPVDYEWTGPDGYTENGATIFDLKAGNYTIIATDAKGCIDEKTFEVKEPAPLHIDPLESPVYSNGFNLSNFQSGDGLIKTPVVSGGTKPYVYSWSADNGYVSGSMNNQLNLMAGDYVLVVTDANACADTVLISLTEPVPLEIPNGISPNGDGFNDYFIVRGLENHPVNRLLVFNRWGNKVYEEKNYQNSDPWYGTNLHGDALPEGTYYVVVELQGADELKGYLEIRR